jgi:hypothetical protein
VSGADHHSKTSSASELSDVSPDSTASAHHSRYTDSEAQSALTGNTIKDIDPFSTLSRDADTQSSNVGTNGGGIDVDPSVNGEGVRMDISSNTGSFSTIEIEDTNGNVITTKTGSFSGGDTVTVEFTLDSSNNYQIRFSKDDTAATLGFTGYSMPISGTEIDIVGGEPYNDPYGVRRITPLSIDKFAVDEIL